MNKVFGRIKKRNKGFTLLELIISIAILSIILIPLSNLVISTFKITNKASIKQEATNLAQKYMEKVKADSSIDLDRIVDEGAIFSSYGYPASENGYNITYTASREDDYSPPAEGGGVDENAFDYRFELSKEENLVKVYKSTDLINSHNITIDRSLNITINNKDQLEYSINGDAMATISKTKNDAEDIYIRIDVNRDDLSNPIMINATNKCKGQLIFYFVKADSLTHDVQCKVINNGGNIIKYENVKSSTAAIQKGRLYKIIIQVEKDEEKIINESYKTVY